MECVVITTEGLILPDITCLGQTMSFFCYKVNITTIYENINQTNDCLRIKKCEVKSG